MIRRVKVELPLRKIAVYNRDIVKVSGPYDSWETAVKNLERAKYIGDLEQHKTIDKLQSQLKPILGRLLCISILRRF